MPNKKITAFTQIGNNVLDRTLDMLPIVDPSEALPANRNKKISVEQLTNEYEVTGTLSSVQLLSIGTTPITIVSAPGVGYYLRVVRADAWIDFNTTAYTSSALAIKHPTAIRPVFSFNVIMGMTVSMGEMAVLQDVVAATQTLLIENDPLELTTFTGVDPTLGDSVINYRVRYEIVPMI